MNWTICFLCCVTPSHHHIINLSNIHILHVQRCASISPLAKLQFREQEAPLAVRRYQLACLAWWDELQAWPGIAWNILKDGHAVILPNFAVHSAVSQGMYTQARPSALAVLVRHWDLTACTGV